MNIITGRTPVEERKQIAKRWVKNIQLQAEGWKSKPFTMEPSDFSQEPTAMSYYRAIFEMKQKKILVTRKKRPDMEDIFKIVDDNKLKYFQPGAYQHRVKNPRTNRMIDWWDGKKQTMRKLDGLYGYQGKHKEFLLQELMKII